MLVYYHPLSSTAANVVRSDPSPFNWDLACSTTAKHALSSVTEMDREAGTRSWLLHSCLCRFAQRNLVSQFT